jgi:hypothetical protein
MEEHSQIVTLYLPADFEKDFADFKENIRNDSRINKLKLTKKDQLVSTALRVLMNWYNESRKKYYAELIKKREEKENATT